MRNERNLGIDALRIISMGMVVLLHTLGVGGILWQAEILSAHYEISWALEIVSYCAVNCFALITGYVMYENRLKYLEGFPYGFRPFFTRLRLPWFLQFFIFQGFRLVKKIG